jgi:hypothetical protein
MLVRSQQLIFPLHRGTQLDERINLLIQRGKFFVCHYDGRHMQDMHKNPLVNFPLL